MAGSDLVMLTQYGEDLSGAVSKIIITTKCWILADFMLVRIMYIMLNWI